MSIVATSLAAALLAAGAAPAPLPTPDAAGTVAAPAAGSSRYAVRYDAKTDQYCLRDRKATPVTGTRLVPQQCKTSGEWAALGLTISRKP